MVEGDKIKLNLKIRKVGNSYGFIVPKDVIDKLDVKENDYVVVDVPLSKNQKERLKNLSPEKQKMIRDLIKQGILSDDLFK